MAKPPTMLSTTASVIMALGGISEVARLTDSNYSAVCNWTKFPTFPANFYALMKDELEKGGYTAPRSLWRQKEKAPAEALSA
jgi:hypothetical protein